MNNYIKKRINDWKIKTSEFLYNTFGKSFSMRGVELVKEAEELISLIKLENEIFIYNVMEDIDKGNWEKLSKKEMINRIEKISKK